MISTLIDLSTPHTSRRKKTAPRTLNIGLFGCGVVGSGIISILHEKHNAFRELLNVEPIVRHICVRDIHKLRTVPIDRTLLTDNPDKLLNDSSLEVIIEVIGGYRDAKQIVLQSLHNRKHTITANKRLLSTDITLLRDAAGKSDVQLLYAASVCGSVPAIRAVSELSRQDTIESIRGIVNGSTNFILSLLAKERCSVQAALDEARRLGFLEADPSLDLCGADAAQKLSVLIYHSFGEHILPEQIETTGIENITESDIDAAARENTVIKLIASASRDTQGRITASVKPERIPRSHMFAHTSNEFNALEIIARNAGPQLLYGKGAGSLPTASAVVSDLLSLAAIESPVNR